MVRIMLGQGLRITRNPPALAGCSMPSLLTTAGSIPKNGLVQEPGLVAVAPGSGEIMMQPVSVCHQVSTIGHRPPPITRWYHIHASGLIGSPTVPSSLSEERSYLLGQTSPHLMNARIAVGAV